MEKIELKEDYACIVLSPDYAVELAFPKGEGEQQVPEHVQVLAAFAALLISDEGFKSEIIRRAFPKPN